MGVMARKSGEKFVITSDCAAGELPSVRPPKKRVYQVWTGDEWSPNLTDAKTFKTIAVADEYIRVNYARVMGFATIIAPLIPRRGIPTSPELACHRATPSLN